MRPKFSDEEAIAMGILVVSIVGNRIFEPTAMVQFAHEYEGYTSGELRSMTNFDTPDFFKSIQIFDQMTDPFKKTYAAGFIATVIKACGCEDDPDVSSAYHNCLKCVLKMGGLDNISDAVYWYEGFEHGKKL